MLRERDNAVVTSPPLVEREDAVADLEAALTAATLGAGSLVVVEGEAGSGKSRLLAEARDRAADREFAVHFARATALERNHSLGVVTKLLEGPVNALDSAHREALLDGGARTAIEILGGSARPFPPADAIDTICNSFYRLYARLAADRPTVVLVDDLQWADRASLRSLAHVADRADDLPLALVVAVRDDAAPPEFDSIDRSTAPVVAARPLTIDGTARVLDDLLGPSAPEFVDAAHAATLGNPFLVRELALGIRHEGLRPDVAGAVRVTSLAPGAVRGWARRRVEALGPTAVRVAESLAVFEQAELAVVFAHAGVGPDSGREAVDGLARAGLAERDLPLRFTHPLVRRAIYAGLPPGSRDEAHHRAAEQLELRGAAPPDVSSQLLNCEARGEVWAAEALRATAATALVRGDADAAVTALARAAAEPGWGEDPRLLAELGRARAAVNDELALEDLERAATIANDSATRIWALAGLAQARYLAGDIIGSFRAAGAALEEIVPGRGGGAEAELLLGYLMSGRQSPELIDATRAAICVDRAGGGPMPAPAEIVRRQARALDAYLTGDRARADADATWVSERLDELGRAFELPPLLAIGPAFVLTGLGEWDRAEGVLDDGLDRARRRGSPLETAECLHERVWQRWRRGDVAGGLADIASVTELTAGAWDPAKVPMLVARSQLLLERGDVERAEEVLRLERELERAVVGTWGWPWLAYGRAAVALAGGRAQEALDLAIEAGRRFAEIDVSSPEFAAWRSVASQAATRLGECDRARELASSELAEADRIGASRAIGTATRALGAASGSEEQIELLNAAVAAFDRSGAQLHRAHARLDLGMALRRARRTRDARAPLREALDLGHRCGSTLVTERALAELRAAGGRVRRERATGPASLTPREREIAALAADGNGNVEIAERLFITRKTVEGHLRTIFRKLDVRRRAELESALRD